MTYLREDSKQGCGATCVCLCCTQDDITCPKRFGKAVMFSSIQWMTNVSNGRGAFPIWSNKWVNSLPTTYKNETMCSGHNLEMLKVLDRIVPGLLQKITNCHSNNSVPEDQVMPEEAIKNNSYIWKEERYWTENSGYWQVNCWWQVKEQWRCYLIVIYRNGGKLTMVASELGSR